MTKTHHYLMGSKSCIHLTLVVRGLYLCALGFMWLSASWVMRNIYSFFFFISHGLCAHVCMLIVCVWGLVPSDCKHTSFLRGSTVISARLSPDFETNFHLQPVSLFTTTSARSRLRTRFRRTFQTFMRRHGYGTTTEASK